MQSYKSKIKKRFQVINPLKDLMEQGKNVAPEGVDGHF